MNKNKIKKYFLRHDELIYLFVFCYFTIKQFVIYVDTYNDIFSRIHPVIDRDSVNIVFTQISLFYYLIYKYGFIGRGLVGSIIYCCYIIADKISFGIFSYHVDYIVFGAIFRMLLIIGLNIFMCIIIYKIIHMLKDKIGNKCYYLLPLLGFIYSLFFTGYEYRYNDYILFMLQLLSVYLILSGREQFVMIPMIMSVLIHEGAILLSCPVIFALLIAVHITDGKTIKKRLYVRMVVMGLILAALSIYFLKFQQYIYSEKLSEVIETDMLEGLHIPVNDETVELVKNESVLIDQVIQSKGTTKWNAIGNNEYCYVFQFISWICIFIYVATLTPIIVVVLPRLSEKIKTVKNRFQRFEIVIIEWMGVLALIPFFVFKEDMGRWLLYFWIYYGVLAFYGLYIGSPFVVGIFDVLKERIVKFVSISRSNVIPIIVYYVSVIPMSIIPVGGMPINVIYLNIYNGLLNFLGIYCNDFLVVVQNVMRNINV